MRKYPPVIAATLLAFLSAAAPTAASMRPDAPSAGAIAPSAGAVRPLLVGAEVPDVVVRAPSGSEVRLREQIGERPTVVIFYRGGWCPYCTRYLSKLQEIDRPLAELGYQVLALSADRPDARRAEVGEKGFGYRLLSDAKLHAARGFGIAFQVDAATLTKYEEYGIDLEAASGETHHALPVPAVFVVVGGRIVFQHVDPNYKARLHPDVLMAVAKTALER